MFTHQPHRYHLDPHALKTNRGPDHRKTTSLRTLMRSQKSFSKSSQASAARSSLPC